MVVGFHYVIQWHSPYTEPPDGKPRILFEWFESAQRRSERMMAGGYHLPPAVLEVNEPGYGLWVGTIEVPRPPVGQERLAAIRKKRLERRMREKHPLFADEFIRQEMERKGDYYAGKTDAELAKKSAEARGKVYELYKRFCEFVEQHESAELAQQLREMAAWLFE